MLICSSDIMKDAYSYNIKDLERTLQYLKKTDFADICKYYSDHVLVNIADRAETLSYNKFSDDSERFSYLEYLDWDKILSNNISSNKDEQELLFKNWLFKLTKDAYRNLKRLLKKNYSTRIVDSRTMIRSFINKIIRRNTEEDVASISNINLFINKIFSVTILKNGQRDLRYYKYPFTS